MLMGSGVEKTYHLIPCSFQCAACSSPQPSKTEWKACVARLYLRLHSQWASLKFRSVVGGVGCSGLRSPERSICLAPQTLVHWELFLPVLPLTDVALGKDLQQFSGHQGKRRHRARNFFLPNAMLQMQLRSARFLSAQSHTLAISVLLEMGRGLSQGNLHFKMEFFKAPKACRMGEKKRN